MGPKSPMAEGFIFLGTKVKIVALTSFKNFLEVKKYLIVATTFESTNRPGGLEKISIESIRTKSLDVFSSFNVSDYVKHHVQGKLIKHAGGWFLRFKAFLRTRLIPSSK
jgi:hypothetical protein